VKNFSRELDKYSPDYSESLVRLVNENHNLEKNTGRILETYKEVREEKPTLDSDYKKVILEINYLVNALKDKDYQLRNPDDAW
jgi:hypothetical protein